MARNPISRGGNGNNGNAPGNGLALGQGGGAMDALERHNLDSLSDEVQGVQGRDFVHTNDGDLQFGGDEGFSTVPGGEDGGATVNFNLDGGEASVAAGGGGSGGGRTAEETVVETPAAGATAATGSRTVEAAVDVPQQGANGTNGANAGGGSAGSGGGGGTASASAPGIDVSLEEESADDGTDDGSGPGGETPPGIEINTGDITQIINVDLSCALINIDITELTSVIIQGLPLGVRLNIGEENGDGNWLLDPEFLGDVALSLPPGLGEKVDLSVVAQTVNQATGAVTTITAPVVVNVASIIASKLAQLDGVVDAASGAADVVPVPVADITDDLNAILDGLDLSSEATVTISGLVAGATLNVGEPGADKGDWTISLGDGTGGLGRVEISFGSSYDGNDGGVEVPDLSISVEALNSVTGVLTEITAPLPIAPLIDHAAENLPNLEVDTGSGPVAAPVSEGLADTIEVNLSAALLQLDLSAAAEITINGLPAGTELSDGMPNGDGSWMVPTDAIGELLCTVPAAVSTAGALALGVVATAVDVASGAVTTVTTPISVPCGDEEGDGGESSGGSSDGILENAADGVNGLAGGLSGNDADGDGGPAGNAGDGLSGLADGLSGEDDGGDGVGDNLANGAGGLADGLSGNDADGSNGPAGDIADGIEGFVDGANANGEVSEGILENAANGIGGLADGLAGNDADGDNGVQGNAADGAGGLADGLSGEDDGGDGVGDNLGDGLAALADGLSGNDTDGSKGVLSDAADGFDDLVDGLNGNAGNASGTEDANTGSETDTAPADSASGDEPRISIDLSTSLQQLDLSATASVTLSNLPASATLSSGVQGGDGNWTVPTSAIGSLVCSVPASAAADGALDFSVLSATVDAATGLGTPTVTPISIALNTNGGDAGSGDGAGGPDGPADDSDGAESGDDDGSTTPSDTDANADAPAETAPVGADAAVIGPPAVTAEVTAPSADGATTDVASDLLSAEETGGDAATEPGAEPEPDALGEGAPANGQTVTDAAEESATTPTWSDSGDDSTAGESGPEPQADPDGAAADQALAQLFGLDGGGDAVPDGDGGTDCEPVDIGSGGDIGGPLINDCVDTLQDNALSITW